MQSLSAHQWWWVLCWTAQLEGQPGLGLGMGQLGSPPTFLPVWPSSYLLVSAWDQVKCVRGLTTSSSLKELGHNGVSSPWVVTNRDSVPYIDVIIQSWVHFHHSGHHGWGGHVSEGRKSGGSIFAGWKVGAWDVRLRQSLRFKTGNTILKNLFFQSLEFYSLSRHNIQQNYC